MEELTGEEVDKLVENDVYPEKQRTGKSYILTLGKVEILKERGSLDFGGGEYNASELKEIRPVKRNEDDDYGWYNLSEGFYLVTLNEKLSLGDNPGVLQPWWKLLRNGATHQTQNLSGDHDDIKLLLQVGEQGVRLKENARITELKAYD